MGRHDEFERFFEQVEPRLRRAFVATHGIEGAADATAEAMAWAWERWEQCACSTIQRATSTASASHGLGRAASLSFPHRARCGSPVVAVADEEYLVWAGEAGENDISHRADGFAVDLASGSVRAIPVAPIDPRPGATGVWTGDELIVCCGTGQADGFRADTRSAAAWVPETSRWRELARPPASIARSFAAAVWTGEVIVVVAPGPGRRDPRSR